jgi:hypothetical protein
MALEKVEEAPPVKYFFSMKSATKGGLIPRTAYSDKALLIDVASLLSLDPNNIRSSPIRKLFPMYRR